MPNTALITGATAGIGRELARYHASRGGDLIITARRGDLLDELKQALENEHDITVHTIALDLAAKDGAQNLYDKAKETGAQIDILINNAGFGGHGNFIERPLAEDLAMIDLNVGAVVVLCHLVGKDMAARGRGKILNVSSTASYMPGPLQATYFASKAFVSSFSQALAEELRPSGVTVTALEPGYVETGFAARANLEGTDLVKSGATARSVAIFGYNAMRAGELRAINDGKLRFALNWLFPFMPRKLILKTVRRLQQKKA